ncbi:MAG: amino acid permease [Clostridiales bacterium]|nr:amino acid permease [Clostridiales bacterium]
MNSNKHQIGMFSAAMMLTGAIIGSSIFIATGWQAENMGPSVWFTYVIGALLSVPACFQYAQIGSVMPMRGACYETIKRTTGDLSAFIYGWLYIVWICIFLPYCAHAIAKYFLVYFPEAPVMVIAVAVLVFFGALNCIGLGVAAKVQNVIVGILIASMLVFIFCGIKYFDPANMTPLFPYGGKAVIDEIVPSYFGFIAFYCITEWAGEIKDAKRNLPRAVMLTLAIVSVLYIGLSFMLCGVVNYTELGMDAVVAAVAKALYSPAAAIFIFFGCIAATVSTVNGMMATIAREIAAIADHGYLPKVLAKTNERGAPYYAVILCVILAIIICFISDQVMVYIDVVTIFMLVGMVHAGVASLFIKKKMANEYQLAPFKLKGFWYYFWPLAIVIPNIAIIIYTLIGVPNMIVPSLLITVVGCIIFFAGNKRMAKNNLSNPNN